MGLFDFLFNKKEGNTANKKEVSIMAVSSHTEKELLEKTELQPGISVCGAFAKHWDMIEPTALPCIAIAAKPSEDLALEQSKFGHYPFMPASFQYPADAVGKFMYPLAQINFKELPSLPGYPASGYLQLYISASDDVYGIDFDNYQSQKNFRVLFFEENEITDYKADFSFLDEVMASDILPVNKPHALAFSLKNEFVGMGDVRYEEKGSFKIEQITHQFPSIQDELEDEAYSDFSGNGHKVGGYAFFTQEDPRIHSEKFGDYILLQIDTDDEIMWGDSGVANFFIHPDDLAKKDFSKVLYNWDCS